MAHLYKGKEDNIGESIWDKSEMLCRKCWIAYWELGEHNGKLMGTHWELKRNIVETHWELGKNEKKIAPLLPQTYKETKARHLECMLGSIKFLFPKESVTIFGPG